MDLNNKIMPILVKDVMTKRIISIDQNKTIQDAAKLFSKVKKGFLIVTRRNNAIGIISKSDIVSKVVAKNLKPNKIKIKEIMSKPLIVVRPDEDIASAARKMIRNKIHRLPVVNRGRIVGVISMTDIVVSAPQMVNILEKRLKIEEPFEIKERITAGICDSCDNYDEELKKVNDQWLCESCRELEEK